MFCTHCGKEITIDATFCPYCGERIIIQKTVDADPSDFSSVMEGDIYVGRDQKKRFEAHEIRRMFGYLNDKRALFEDYEAKLFLRDELNKYGEAKELKVKAWIIFIIAIVMSIASLVLSDLGNPTNSTVIDIFEVLIMASPFILFILFLAFLIASGLKKGQTLIRIEQTEKEIQSDWEEIEKYYRSLPACPIGVSWFTIAGLDIIISMMKNNEASSIKEAIQKTTEAQARERMNQQYIEAIEESGKTAARGAIAGGAIVAVTNVSGRIFSRIRSSLFG